MRRSRRWPVAVFIGTLVGHVSLAAPAIAQDSDTVTDTWSFTLSPYIWFSGLNGDVSTPHATESFSAGFGDIFDALKFSAMGLLEARRGNVSLIMDTMYLNLQQGAPIPDHGAFSGGSIRTQSAEISAIGLYTALENPTGRLEIGGGLRAWWFDSALKLHPGLLPGRTESSSTSWVDPLIAARGTLRLNDPLSLTIYGDIGGFGVGSQFTWQAMATLDWRISDSMSASAGYRWIHIDYDKGRSTISLDMRGPIIGATLRF